MCWWCPAGLKEASYQEPILLLAESAPSLKSFAASQLAQLLQALLARARVVEIAKYSNGSFQRFVVGVTPPNSSEDFLLEPGSAYWARIEGEGESISLPAQASIEPSLQHGWNFVTVAGVVRASQAFPAAGQLSLWQPEQQAFADFIPGFHPPLGENDFWLMPGDAVWVFSGERALPQAEAAIPLPHTVYGMVSEGAAPADGAGVTLIVENTGEELHAVADSQGKFSINLASARSGYYDGDRVRVLASKEELLGQASLAVDAARPNQRIDLQLAEKPNLRLSLSPSKQTPAEGEAITLTATLSNEGSEPVNASVGFYIDGSLAETRGISLAPRSSQQVEFAWNASRGLHVFLASAEPLPLEGELSDNSANASLAVLPTQAIEAAPAQALAPPSAELAVAFVILVLLALVLWFFKIRKR